MKTDRLGFNGTFSHTNSPKHQFSSNFHDNGSILPEVLRSNITDYKDSLYPQL